jgi:hypothetical protein
MKSTSTEKRAIFSPRAIFIAIFNQNSDENSILAIFSPGLFLAKHRWGTKS